MRKVRIYYHSISKSAVSFGNFCIPITVNLMTDKKKMGTLIVIRIQTVLEWHCQRNISEKFSEKESVVKYYSFKKISRHSSLFNA